MYSDDCRIENNILTGNSVGAYLMYSRRLHLIHNTIAHNRGPSGYGIGLKDFDDGLLIENLIVDNRVGLFVDNSPREIESTMTYRGNVIAYNDIGMKLFSFIERSKIVNNSFMENYEQVAVSGSGLLTGNDWNQNFWSDYVGYDQGDDGIGDIPYKYENLFENLMNKHPNLRLFIYSPAIQALEFAAQAFPVVKPKPKFVDPNPRMTPSIPQGLASIDLPTRWTLSTAALGLIVFGSVLTLGLSKKSKRLNRDAKMKSKKTNKPGPKHSSEKEHTAEMWIEVRHLTKRFGKLTAVNDVSFTVTRGEAVAFWGSNGAGKTTVLRCLLGVIPFQGDVSINGYKVNEESKQARHLIGFVPQEISFHDNLSVQETVEFYAQLKKSTPETIGDLIDKLGLRPHVLKTIKELSGGMKQRVALAIALLGNPPILFLDEPTANLDMRSRDDFLELLGELQEEGKTIVFSSHRLEEVFSFSNRVLILDQGKLIADSPPDEVYEHLGKHSLLRIYVSPQLVSNALDILTNNGFKVSRNGKGLKVQVDSHSKGKPITLLAKQGVPVDNFEYEVES
ncbi:MAG: ATP-binding cassette domain-containing protein [Calditrichae bacterium]|nr:ATP-binding cassette domain-containing protein [Calditrichia bacterium]